MTDKPQHRFTTQLTLASLAIATALSGAAWAEEKVTGKAEEKIETIKVTATIATYKKVRTPV